MKEKVVKKTSSSRRPAKAAAKSSDRLTVKAYLARVREPARSTLLHLREVICSAAPAEAEEVISYGMPAFRYKGALVAYAAFKDHCSFFPMQASMIDQMKEELADYRTAKGTLQFPLDKPLPDRLVRRMVRLRVAENERRARLRT